MQQITKTIILCLIVCILISSCTTIKNSTKIPYITPPIYEPVNFQAVEGGSFIDHDNEKALLRNEAKKNGYIKQLEEAIRIYNN